MFKPALLPFPDGCALSLPPSGFPSLSTPVLLLFGSRGTGGIVNQCLQTSTEALLKEASRGPSSSALLSGHSPCHLSITRVTRLMFHKGLTPSITQDMAHFLQSVLEPSVKCRLRSHFPSRYQKTKCLFQNCTVSKMQVDSQIFKRQSPGRSHW